MVAMPPFLIVFSIPVLLLLSAMVTKMWEKRLVWPYAPADPATV